MKLAAGTPPAVTTTEGTAGFNPDKADDSELNERTRARFREKLKNGELEDRNIEIEVNSSKTPMMQAFGPQGVEEVGADIKDMVGNLPRGGSETKRTRPTSE